MSAHDKREDSSSISDEKADLKLTKTNDIVPDVPILESGRSNDSGLMCRVDLFVMPIMTLLNFGAARLDSFGVTIMGFKNNDYWVSLLVFFIGYIIFQLPGALFVRRYHPRFFLFAIVFFWGIDGGIAVAFLQNWQQLAVVRAILGALQSGFLSVCTLLITCWYTRFELGFRMAIFYQAQTLAHGGSPILAYVVMLMNGASGLRGWQWVFIIFGSLIVCISFLALMFVPNFPERATFLNEEDRKRVLERLEKDRNDHIACDAHIWEKVVYHFRCWMIWALGLAYGCSNVAASALSTVGKARFASLGYSPAGTAALSIPAWFIAAGFAVVMARHSDRKRIRAPYIIVAALMCIIGFGCTLSKNVGAGVFGTFLAYAGSATQLSLIMVMLQNNVRGTCKRAVAGAIALGFGAVGYMASATLFISSSAPQYRQGCIASIAMQIGLCIIVGAVAFRFCSMNAKLDSEEASLEESTARKGSETVQWRYTL